MKHLFIRLQLDKSPIPQHVHAGTVAIHHILDRKCRVKDTDVSCLDVKDIFQKFVAPKPLTNKHLLLCFQLSLCFKPSHLHSRWF